MIQKRPGPIPQAAPVADLLSLDEAQIWGRPQLIQLRDEVHMRIEKSNASSVTIDMSHVLSLPGGFFGLLYDLHDEGLQVCLFNVQEPVRRMIWFRRFFSLMSSESNTPQKSTHRFRDKPMYIENAESRTTVNDCN